MMSRVGNIALLLLITLSILWLDVCAQDKQEMGGFSAGTTSGPSSNASFILYTVVGQPIAYSSNVPAEIHAGFMQVGSYVIPDITKPTINYSAPLANIVSGAINTIAVTITDNGVIATARLWKRKITAPLNQYDFVDLVAGTAGSYSKAIDAAWHDAMGIEFYFTATDAAGNSSESAKYQGYVTTPELTIPGERIGFGTTASKYKIFTLPYDLATNSELEVDAVFDEVPPPHNDNLKVGRYSNPGDKYEEYPFQFQRGTGYWVLVRNNALIKITNAESPAFHRSSLFEMSLKEGWNLIGNPYPVEISWGDVQAFVGSAGIGGLQIWNGGYDDATKLQPFEGAWVKATSDVTIKIPFTGQTTPGGRDKAGEATDLRLLNWSIRLSVQQNDLGNRLGAFGMHESTQDELDEKDGYNPPPIGGSPEVNFSRINQEKALAKDIVLTKEEMDWTFQVKGNKDDPTELTWSEGIETGGKDLLLVDELNLAVIDMSRQGKYSFSLKPNNMFKIYFGTDARKKMKADEVMIRPPFPNPVNQNEEPTFNLALPEATSNWKVRVDLYHASGGAADQYTTELQAGIQELKLKLREDMMPGLYFYTVRVYSGSSQKFFTGKIIIGKR